MKTISYDDYLKALALWTIMKEHTSKANQFELQLSKLLNYTDDGGGPYCGHLSDSAYFGNNVSFDLALEREGFEVEK